MGTINDVYEYHKKYPIRRTRYDENTLVLQEGQTITEEEQIRIREEQGRIRFEILRGLLRGELISICIENSGYQLDLEAMEFIDELALRHAEAMGFIDELALRHAEAMGFIDELALRHAEAIQETITATRNEIIRFLEQLKLKREQEKLKREEEELKHKEEELRRQQNERIREQEEREQVMQILKKIESLYPLKLAQYIITHEWKHMVSSVRWSTIKVTISPHLPRYLDGLFDKVKTITTGGELGEQNPEEAFNEIMRFYLLNVKFFNTYSGNYLGAHLDKTRYKREYMEYMKIPKINQWIISYLPPNITILMIAIAVMVVNSLCIIILSTIIDIPKIHKTLETIQKILYTIMVLCFIVITVAARCPDPKNELEKKSREHDLVVSLDEIKKHILNTH